MSYVITHTKKTFFVSENFIPLGLRNHSKRSFLLWWKAQLHKFWTPRPGPRPSFV